MHELNVKDLVVNVDGNQILKGLNINIKAGEVHALMGPNGSGKSTLSKSIMGHPDYEVISGDVTLDFEMFLNLEVESVAGSVEVSGDLSSSGSFALDVHSGEITLTVPGDVSAEFEANSFNGDIKTDFGYEGSQTSKYLPGQELEFSVGGGGGDVEINTFSGDINIRKK